MRRSQRCGLTRTFATRSRKSATSPEKSAAVALTRRRDSSARGVTSFPSVPRTKTRFERRGSRAGRAVQVKECEEIRIGGVREILAEKIRGCITASPEVSFKKLLENLISSFSFSSAFYSPPKFPNVPPDSWRSASSVSCIVTAFSLVKRKVSRSAEEKKVKTGPVATPASAFGRSEGRVAGNPAHSGSRDADSNLVEPAAGGSRSETEGERIACLVGEAEKSRPRVSILHLRKAV